MVFGVLSCAGMLALCEHAQMLRGGEKMGEGGELSEDMLMTCLFMLESWCASRCCNCACLPTNNPIITVTELQ
jgi:hypothetical protein